MTIEVVQTSNIILQNIFLDLLKHLECHKAYH